jgi:hypothetical protein
MKQRKFKIRVERLPVYEAVNYYPANRITTKIIEFTEYENVCRLNTQTKSARFNQKKFLKAFKAGEVRDIIEFTSGGGPVRPTRYQLIEIIEELS